ncbi:MAG: hypothetical protein ACFFAU_19170 [Candidatus Hodarchaeota archaeon]
MKNNLEKLVEDIVLTLDPNATEEIMQEAKQKANDLFHKNVNDFLDEIEITVKKKQE